MTVRNSKGDEGGPLPGISGPFGTVAVLFEAWADSVKLKLDREEIAAVMPRTSFPAERTVSIIENFPLQIKAIASRLTLHNEGPFPLDHDDLLHNNIMGDQNSFEVTGIIDWEGACTVPLKLISFPEFLASLPVALGSPESYNLDE